MCSLRAFLSAGPDDVDAEALSPAASDAQWKGVFPMLIRGDGERTLLKFSSRRRLGDATSIAKSYIKARYGAVSQLENHEDYEFRGYFWMAFID